MWHDADGLYFYVDHVAHKLGDVSSEQLSAYVESQVSSKVEISAFNELQNSLSNYYTKNETSSSSEISIALDGKQPTGDYALTSQLPTKISELSNDSGFITLADIPIPSYIEDVDGNKIEADLDCAVKDLTLPWTLADGADTYTLNYSEQSGNWLYEEA